tara:strand:+ start:840 stop:1157 length:318 start_codon:yes stop_codon:yes gene_type:complete
MKLRLCWSEKYEVMRQYPPVEVDSEKYPELELELLDVYRAQTAEQQQKALDNLEYKMHQTPAGERGETIFEMVEPYSHDLYQESVVYPLSEEEGGFKIFEEDSDG